MTDLPDNVKQMLVHLIENSKRELDLVHELAEGIRRVDDPAISLDGTSCGTICIQRFAGRDRFADR